MSLFLSRYIGPPLALSPSITEHSPTSFQLSWERSFTLEGYDIEYYTVRIQNTVTNEEETRVINATDEELYYLQFAKEGGIAEECVELVFTVTATNTIGESEPSVISGGYPIGKTTIYYEWSTLAQYRAKGGS